MTETSRSMPRGARRRWDCDGTRTAFLSRAARGMRSSTRSAGAGPHSDSVLERRIGGDALVVLRRDELTARAVDLLAAGVAQSRGDAGVVEAADELVLRCLRRRRPDRPGRR